MNWGRGSHGQDRSRHRRASLSMLITVVPEDKIPSLVTGLRRLLEDLAHRPIALLHQPTPRSTAGLLRTC